MCGIFGIVARDTTTYPPAFIRKAIKVLAKCSESRGKDSSGLAFRDERTNTYKVFKGAVPLNYLLQTKAVKAYFEQALITYTNGQASARANTFSVIGHSRLVTNGSQLHDDNNQPVSKDGIIGIHNGIVVNDAALWEKYPTLSRDYDIDTEVLLALIRHYIENEGSIAAAIQKVALEVEGTFSISLLFEDLGALVLATNNGSLYTISNGKNLLCFASEKYPVHLLAEQMGLDQKGNFAIQQIPSGHGIALTFDGFILEEFQLAEAQGGAVRGMKEEKPFKVDITSVTNGKASPELVLDVALIAKAPEAARQEALLEFNADRVAALRRCTKCILPETFPFIDYDEDGVCNYCRDYRIKNQPKPLDELLELIKPYRRTDGKPDCIVPFSGGRDSTYSLHVIKKVLGLNPIAFTYDWGMVTDLGRRNIARVCGKLGVENIIVAADIHWKRDNIHKNITAWLKKPHLGMIPLFMAGDKYFYYYIDQVKKQTGIDLNIWGVNPLENTDFKVGFIGVGPDPKKERIYSLSVKRKALLFKGITQAILSNPSYLNSSVWDTLGSFFARSIRPHQDYFHLYDYVQWDEDEINEILLDEYDWEKAIDTDTTWRIGDGTAAFYNYIYYNVAGFSEHDTFRSNQIREGMITREEALAHVNRENRPRYATIKWYTDVVRIDYEEAIKVINSIPKLYT